MCVHDEIDPEEYDQLIESFNNATKEAEAELKYIMGWKYKKKLKLTQQRVAELTERIKNHATRVKRLNTLAKNAAKELKRLQKQLPELQKNADQEDFLERMNKV